MQIRLVFTVCGAACAALLVFSGCRPVDTASATAPAPSSDTKPASTGADTTAVPSSHSPLKDAIVAMLAEDSRTFPVGTRLKSVDLADGVASLDFSSEFNAVANMGETGESLAQKKIQSTLAQFPTVDKMRVTVEGRPFESQATDWTTPFLVRSKRSASRERAPRAPRPMTDGTKSSNREAGDRP